METDNRSLNQELRQPLGGTNGDWRHRFFRFHIPLAVASAAVIIVWMSFPFLQAAFHQGPTEEAQATTHQSSSHSGSQPTGHQGTPQPDSTTARTDHDSDQTANADTIQNRLFIARFTTATGYVALGLLGLTLLIGPANLLLRRRTPVSSYLARDIGIWAAILSVIHVIAGFFVHGPPAPFYERVIFYYFAPDGSPLTNAFGWGNWTGLAATLIVLALLVISNDVALRKLKARKWKNLQRLNYVLFGLVTLHAIYYGALLRVTSIPTLLLGMIVILVLIGQAVGVRLWRRRHSRVSQTT